jgi:drug/metabolite transporter (DMT)-like permease
MTSPRLGKAYRAEGMLLMATLIWGSTFPVVKNLLSEVSPLQMMVLRFGLASIVVLSIAWKSIFPLTRIQLLHGGVLGAVFFCGFVLQTVGLTLTTASKSAFITGLLVIFVPFLQIGIERRPPRLGNMIGIGVVLTGLYFLTVPGDIGFNFGDVLTLVCAVVFAVYIVYLDVAVKSMNTVQVLFLQIATNAFLSLCAACAFGRLDIHLSPGGMLGVGYLTISATIITVLIQSRYQRETTPTRAAVIYSVEPVVAAILSWVILGETLGISGVTGASMILAGVLISEFSGTVRWLAKPIGRSTMDDAEVL